MQDAECATNVEGSRERKKEGRETGKEKRGGRKKERTKKHQEVGFIIIVSLKDYFKIWIKGNIKGRLWQVLGSFVGNQLKCRLLHSCLNAEVIFSFKISGEGD